MDNKNNIAMIAIIVWATLTVFAGILALAAHRDHILNQYDCAQWETTVTNKIICVDYQLIKK